MSALGLILVLTGQVFAQYPGKVAKGTKADPVLRSVAVLEWMGEAGKPSASRLVPVSVFDGEALNDGTIYLSRPEPLALASGVEYELQAAGKPLGVYDVFGAGEAEGAWRGFGKWKALSAVAAKRAESAFNTSSLNAPVDLPDDDKPVLKRKHPKGTDAEDAGGANSKAGGESGSAKKEPVDSDRPTLKKSEGTTTEDDPDRPTIRRKAGDSGSDAGAASEGAGTVSVDPDRPTIRRSRHAEEADAGEVSTAAPDPDRPLLKRGKPADYETKTDTPKLEGTPPDLQQGVAVSDARTLAEHPWKYSWANTEDENKMKSALEAMARTALGMDAPAKPATPARKGAVAAKRPGKSMLPAAEPEPVALGDERFQVFELAYGATATMVLTASTPEDGVSPPSMKDSVSVTSVSVKGSSGEAGTPVKDADAPVIRRGKPVGKTQAEAVGSADVKTKAGAGKAGAKKAGQDGTDSGIVKPKPRKFVTLIAQPDLYGGVLVLFKSVTDAAHLDQTPRMRLVDAVDAMGDNRGELLFELRGAGERKFGLYRVNRGSAEQLFATVAIP